SAGSFTAGEETTREVLKPLDIATTAGATADIAGALNTLPGTQRVGETGRLFVRGGEGVETRTFIDGMLVSNAYSPAAPNTPGRNRFSPFMFSGTSFSTGGYSAEYGQALSSVLVLKSKNEALLNRTDVSIMSVGGTISHVHKGEDWSVAGKLGYTNLKPYFQLARQRIQWNKAPETFETNVIFRKKYDKGLFKFYTNFNKEVFNIFRPHIMQADVQDQIDLNNQYLHLQGSNELQVNDKLKITSGLSHTRQNEALGFNEDVLNEHHETSHGKVVLDHYINENLNLKSGAEIIYTNHRYNYQTSERGHLNYGQSIAAGFSELDVYFSNKTVLRAGLRYTTDRLSNLNYIVPRFSLAQQVGKNGQFSLAYGEFNQAVRPEYLRINQTLDHENVRHHIASYQWIKNGRTFRLESYDKRYTNLIKFGTENLNEPSTYTNEGEGYARGIDLFFRDNQSIKGLDYWVSYSFLDSERDYLNYPTSAVPVFASAHNFSLVAKYFMQDIQSQLGLTYSYGSPRPYNDPNTAHFNSGRTRSFNDLSLNISHLLNPQVIIHGSVTNVLGFDNVFGYEYAGQVNNEGVYQRRAIRQPAPRFFFVGIFITLSKDKTVNRLPEL
ncbi:MAG: TonB-dependent receptor plug domain-containing protein, partial [Bacteroidota bacterium]